VLLAGGRSQQPLAPGISDAVVSWRRRIWRPHAVLELREKPPSKCSRSYLRSAQAYILISMPTCTSTIFGVFQVIRVLLCQRQGRQGSGRSLDATSKSCVVSDIVMRRGFSNKLGFSVVRRTRRRRSNRCEAIGGNHGRCSICTGTPLDWWTRRVSFIYFLDSPSCIPGL
jgi:hypothetical protein